MAIYKHGDISDMNDSELRAYIVSEWRVYETDLAQYRIILAYEDESNYEGTALYVLRRKSDGVFFTVHGSHCSCYGFEDQFIPEQCDKDYLLSDSFAYYLRELTLMKAHRFLSYVERA